MKIIPEIILLVNWSEYQLNKADQRKDHAYFSK